MTRRQKNYFNHLDECGLCHSHVTVYDQPYVQCFDGWNAYHDAIRDEDGPWRDNLKSLYTDWTESRRSDTGEAAENLESMTFDLKLQTLNLATFLKPKHQQQFDRALAHLEALQSAFSDISREYKKGNAP